MSIKINNTDLRIRPSAVESFYGCAYQWGKTFLEGIQSIPNTRAAIGTSIHAGVESMWLESMAAKKKVPNLTAMMDAAEQALDEEIKTGLKFDSGEGKDESMIEVKSGMTAFIDDIMPFTEIPDVVEEFFKVDLDTTFVKELGGTVDYLGNGILADIKTTKRKSGPEGHIVQQSLYKYLVEANGGKVEANLIQQVVLKKQSEGAILKLDPNVDYSKSLVNTMLDTLDLVAKDIAPIETILRGNPKHIFCSEKYCNHYKTCPFVKGSYEPKTVVQNIKL